LASSASFDLDCGSSSNAHGEHMSRGKKALAKLTASGQIVKICDATHGLARPEHGELGDVGHGPVLSRQCD
jgi:hypothetical protein